MVSVLITSIQDFLMFSLLFVLIFMLHFVGDRFKRPELKFLSWGIFTVFVVYYVTLVTAHETIKEFDKALIMLIIPLWLIYTLILVIKDILNYKF